MKFFSREFSIFKDEERKIEFIPEQNCFKLLFWKCNGGKKEFLPEKQLL
jgi:hypothetical protein